MSRSVARRLREVDRTTNVTAKRLSNFALERFDAAPMENRGGF